MPDNHDLPLVSVIIPTYNKSKLLRLTIESVLAQTYPAIELIVVDDGSTDDTPSVAREFGGRIIYVRQDNLGGEAARNNGFKIARGAYINFFDHDDLMMPTKIERQVQLLEARSEIGVAHCQYDVISEDGEVLYTSGPLPEGDVLKDLAVSCSIWSGGPLIRRECLDRVGLYDDDVWSGDWDLWLRIARAGYQFACVQERLGKYRVTQGSAMVNVARTEQLDIRILDKVFSDPNLPAAVAALKHEAYGFWRFWLSSRYYSIGRWEDAQRNLVEALSLRPSILSHPESQARHFCNSALDGRHPDPVQCITDIFDHLPAEAEQLRSWRPWALAYVYLSLALRSYRAGAIERAKEQMAQAVAWRPEMLSKPDTFIQMIMHSMIRLPNDDPLRFVDIVLENLPPVARRLRAVRPQLLGAVSIARAFDSYAAGERRETIRHVLSGLRYQPSSITNRGLASIFIRSLLPLQGGI